MVCLFIAFPELISRLILCLPQRLLRWFWQGFLLFSAVCTLEILRGSHQAYRRVLLVGSNNDMIITATWLVVDMKANQSADVGLANESDQFATTVQQHRSALLEQNHTIQDGGATISSSLDVQTNNKEETMLNDTAIAPINSGTNNSLDPSVSTVSLDSPPPLALFYNLYIPHTEDDINNAKRIVREQLGQMAAANLSMHSSSDVVLYYNTIGNETVDVESLMEEVCVGFACVHMKHYEQGFEEVTLTEVYNYCQEHTNASVIYLHSKGSFHNHPDGTNDHWRRYMTMAVTSPSCIYGIHNTTCNVCGLYFFPVWSMMFAGNFFTTKCSYVQKLLPPTNYSEIMTSLVGDLFNHSSPAGALYFQYSLFNKHREGVMGADRYAAEFWSASHPSVVPCDMSVTNDFFHWLKGHDSVDNELQWSLAPCTSFWDGRWLCVKYRRQRQLAGDHKNRMHEYFLLAGNLYKWLTIYKDLPPDDSWVWDWYPDGSDWKWIKDMPWQARDPVDLISNTRTVAFELLNES
jgi:hypothetical protein